MVVPVAGSTPPGATALGTSTTTASAPFTPRYSLELLNILLAELQR
jgi:hypothetical protein